MALVPQAVFDIYKTVVDDMINSSFGVNCKLIYPAIKVSCGNCVYDTMNNRSSNIYNGTGPVPFTFGICPWCDGLGFKETPQTEIIKLRIYFARKNWIKVGPMINIPDGSLQALGFLSDLPKIKQAQQMEANSNQSGFGQMLYKLYGEPTPYGFRNDRYLVSIWQRA